MPVDDIGGGTERPEVGGQGVRTVGPGVEDRYTPSTASASRCRAFCSGRSPARSAGDPDVRDLRGPQMSRAAGWMNLHLGRAVGRRPASYEDHGV